MNTEKNASATEGCARPMGYVAVKRGDKLRLYEREPGAHTYYWRSYTVNYADLTECEITADDLTRTKRTFPTHLVQQLVDLQRLADGEPHSSPRVEGA